MRTHRNIQALIKLQLDPVVAKQVAARGVAAIGILDRDLHRTEHVASGRSRRQLRLGQHRHTGCGYSAKANGGPWRKVAADQSDGGSACGCATAGQDLSESDAALRKQVRRLTRHVPAAAIGIHCGL